MIMQKIVKISASLLSLTLLLLFLSWQALAEQYPRGHKELRGSFFRSHGPRDTVTWFSERGVVLKVSSSISYNTFWIE